MRPAFGKDWTQIYEQTKPSIPILVMNAGYCSGTLIEKDLVITAAHCVAPLRKLLVTWSSKVGDFQEGQVVAMDKKADIALVRLPSPRPETPIKVIAREKALKVGEDVATVGHPARPEIKWSSDFPFDKEETYLMSSGIVSGLNDEDLITDLSLTPGNSGGPVLNRDGELVAVVSRKRVGPAIGDIGYATSRKRIYDLLDDLKKDGDRPPSIYRARSAFEFAVTFWNGNLLAQERNSNFWSTGFEFRWAIFDRLYLGYTGSFNGTPRYSSFMIGPKFVLNEKSGHAWVVSPQAESVTLDYVPDPAVASLRETTMAYSLYVRTSRSPMAFKAGYVPRRGGEFFFNIQLSLF